ncbi:EAL domain-containing protein [Marinobacterium lutimaris]|uniref:cyclic-guanylate-specific phosphodiesterase n=1 Tax=Marinobacterium lutimaris TaxID=568106 RepID=A0A1H5XCS9_9GAMM|nr:EAL domain-containing protein [Marinobacterium lutimaris]SEG09584.1 sensor c-di-GMP phosphodiesterase, contains CSS-motif sensor and EAL domain [Marinobacterium lutimaris]
MNSTANGVFDKVCVIFISVLVGLSTYFTSYILLKGDFEASLQRQASASLNQIEVVADDVLSTLDTLNALDAGRSQDCDADTLLEMRQAMFVSANIKGVSFVKEGYLICSAALGRLEQAVKIEEPDFITDSGASVWIDVPIRLTDKELQAMVIQSGSFSGVIHRDFLEKLVTLDTAWRLDVADGVTSRLEDSLVAAGPARRLGKAFKVHDCIKTLPFCITITATNLFFHRQYYQALVGWVAVSFLLALFSALGVASFIRRYRSTEARVMRGLNADAFHCLYQPIVELRSGKIIGCEALARFRDANGDIGPDLFIPVIHSRNKTWPFTQLIINRMLDDVGSIAILPKPFKININFFAQDIENARILELLSSSELQREGIQYVLEVTENERLSTLESSDVLVTMAENGFQVAVDDFGTGYSNLSQIRDFQCNTLKIDRSFISAMDGGSVRSTLIPHIVDIAAKIGAEVVAEGIETSRQQKALVDVGVHYGQGYLFGKPTSFKDLVALIEAQNDS